MGDNWAKWDAEHPYIHHPRVRKEGEKPKSSADKLAEMIKSTVGNHEGSRATVHEHGSGGSVVHKSAKGDFKRPVQPKGHKDRADSARTTIRMAAYNRGKKGESPEVGKIAPESGNTGKIRSADRLAAQVTGAKTVKGTDGSYTVSHPDWEVRSAQNRTIRNKAGADAIGKYQDDISRVVKQSGAKGRPGLNIHQNGDVFDDDSGKKLGHIETPGERKAREAGGGGVDAGAEYRAQRAQKYEDAKSKAMSAGDAASTAQEHRAAAALHEVAMEHAASPNHRSLHYKQAENHKKQADLADKQAAREAAKAERATQSKGKPVKLVAEFNGQTHTRTSARPYTHAAIYRNSEGKHYASFHESRASALRGSDGARPIGVVAVRPADEATAADDAARKHYDMVAGRAKQASDTARSARDHDDATKLNRRAAELAPTENHRNVHTKLAETHEKLADNARRQDALNAQKEADRKKASDEAARKVEEAKARVNDRQTKYNDARQKAFEAGRKAETENTPEAYEAASAAHTGAGNLAISDQQQRSHDTQARAYRENAKNLRGQSSASKLVAARDSRAAKPAALTGQNVHKALEGSGLRRKVSQGTSTDYRGRVLQRGGGIGEGKYDSKKNYDGSYRVDVHGDRTTPQGAARHDTNIAKARQALEAKGWQVDEGHTGMAGHLEVSERKADAQIAKDRAATIASVSGKAAAR
jgi:hypothetical protein